jgi:hypothetical protein
MGEQKLAADARMTRIRRDLFLIRVIRVRSAIASIELASLVDSVDEFDSPALLELF